MAAKTAPTFMDRFRQYESEISTVLGFVVVVAIGLGLLFLLRRPAATPQISKTGEETSATEDLMAKENGEKKVVSPGSTYTVERGDHLWKIAEAQYGDGYQWVTIAKANNLQAPYIVQEGQSLTMPAADPSIGKKSETLAKKEEPTKAVTPTITPEGSYTVQTGDNLWKIALSQYNDGYAWVRIYEANKKLIGSNPGIIKTGTTLILPSGK